MGKGDQKSTRGKRVRGSYGKTRPRKASKSVVVVEKSVKAKAEPKPKPAKPKAEKAKKSAEE
ncbi:30S ribosomal protein THX [Epilithonimonas sp.]|uniref:30S ribosomal protein THX n=1 Tax=Epilithonimonas sp. TaxID=2894511 RepID=UPI00289A3F94|nr:30S ribosomal protein THX [Epilithonimonas sp.]